MRRLGFATATAGLLLALAACGTGGQSASTRATTAPPTRQMDPASGPAVTASPTRAAAPATHAKSVAPALRVSRTAYGRALTDRRGFALYRFTHDRSTPSTCYGPCAVAWPPYIVSKPPSAVGVGAHGGLLGSVRRQDGRLQVTYAGRPLYYYIDDRRPGEVLCQGVAEYGGTWNVVAPDGRAIS
jgi:predicted lipoprotein with Yx(FWY)xxD motif